jgi:hypothetical protein
MKQDKAERSPPVVQNIENAVYALPSCCVNISKPDVSVIIECSGHTPQEAYDLMEAVRKLWAKEIGAKP